MELSFNVVRYEILEKREQGAQGIVFQLGSLMNNKSQAIEEGSGNLLTEDAIFVH